MNLEKIIDKDLQNYIIEYAKKQAEKNKEACGIITKDSKLIYHENQHPNPDNNFSFNPATISKITSKDIGIIFHSHILDSQPSYLSFNDLEASRGFGLCPEKYPYLLYHTIFNQWDYYDSSDANPYLLSPYFPKPSKLAQSDNPKDWQFYLGIPFVWGRSDCFGLIKHYFLGVLEQDIGDFRRPSLEQQNQFPYVGWISPWKGEENGFEIMSKGESLRQHDVLEIAQNGGLESNHIAVVVDVSNMQILHSPGIITANVSNVEFYGKHWQARTIKHLRHKSLC